MKITTIGINYLHEKGLVINRPNGSGDNLLLIFKTHGFVWLADGKCEVQPNDAILFRKGTKQFYGNEGALYIDHCIHMDCEEEGEILQHSGILSETLQKTIRHQQL